MSRLFCAVLVSLGLLTPAVAQESQVSRAPVGASAGVTASQAQDAAAALRAGASPQLSADAPAPPLGASGAEGGAAPGQVHRIRDMLTRKFGLAREKAEAISSAVMASASKYSLPPALVLAIISIESRFQARAHGAHGATGLMQVVPAAHRRLVKNLDLTEPAANIEAGSAILHGYLESARGDVSAALKSYGGSTAYAKKVSLRAKDFQAADAAGDTGASPTR
jgi:soluble lytic murein transglycosylase-like protein